MLAFSPPSISMLFALLPPRIRPWAEFAVSVLVFISGIVGASAASKNPVMRALNFVSFLAHSNAPGTFKLPGTFGSVPKSTPVIVPATPGESSK